MDLVSFLFLSAAIIFVGVLGELIFARTNIPDVLLLMLLGILIGPFLLLVDPSLLWKIAPFFSAIALTVILFEGGLHLNIYEVIKNTPASFSLSLLSFIVIGLFVSGLYYLLGFIGLVKGVTLINSLILGATLAGASSILLIPLMLKSKVNRKILDMLGLESTYNDVFVIVAVVALIKFALGSSVGTYGLDNVLKEVAANFAVGLVIGALSGLLWLYIMKFFKTKSHEFIHHYMLTFACLLLVYVISEYLGGSSALAVLMFGLVLGNAHQIGMILRLSDNFTVDTEVRRFNSQVSFFVKTFFFAFIGMLFVLDTQLILIGILITAIIFAARFVSVKIFSIKYSLSKNDFFALWTLIPKGLAAAVVSIMPMQYGIAGTENFIAYTFSVILVTTIIATISFYIVQKKAIENSDQQPEAVTEINVPEMDQI